MVSLTEVENFMFHPRYDGCYGFKFFLGVGFPMDWRGIVEAWCDVREFVVLEFRLGCLW